MRIHGIIAVTAVVFTFGGHPVQAQSDCNALSYAFEQAYMLRQNGAPKTQVLDDLKFIYADAPIASEIPKVVQNAFAVKTGPSQSEARAAFLTTCKKQ